MAVEYKGFSSPFSFQPADQVRSVLVGFETVEGRCHQLLIGELVLGHKRHIKPLLSYGRNLGHLREHLEHLLDISLFKLCLKTQTSYLVPDKFLGFLLIAGDTGDLYQIPKKFDKIILVFIHILHKLLFYLVHIISLCNCSLFLSADIPCDV